MCICEELSTCIYRDLGRQLIFHLNPCLAEVGLGRQTLPRRDARIVTLVKLLLQFVKLVRTEGGAVATELGLFAAVPTACTLVVLAVNICRQQSTLDCAMSGSCTPLFFSSWSRLRLRRNLGLAQEHGLHHRCPLPALSFQPSKQHRRTQNSNILPYQTFKLGLDYSTTPKISTSRFVYVLGKFVF